MRNALCVTRGQRQELGESPRDWRDAEVLLPDSSLLETTFYAFPNSFLTCGIRPPSFRMARTSLGRAGKGQLFPLWWTRPVSESTIWRGCPRGSSPRSSVRRQEAALFPPFRTVRGSTDLSFARLLSADRTGILAGAHPASTLDPHEPKTPRRSTP